MRCNTLVSLEFNAGRSKLYYSKNSTLGKPASLFDIYLIYNILPLNESIATLSLSNV